jgi:hypothetical protein
VDAALADTQHWLKAMVIGLGLCPFADSVFKTNRIRYAVCGTTEAADLLTYLSVELRSLAAAPREATETTLVIAPNTLPHFLDFNDFLGVAEELLEDLNLTGVIQLVGFHPKFQFAETPADAPENYTNRAPHPIIHLLREESVSEVAGDERAMAEIPKRNTRTLQGLGVAKIQQLLQRPS